MKITSRCIVMLLSALLLTTSCLSTDDTEYTYYNDTALTAFSLGTVNKYYMSKTKYTDEDSLIKTTLTGSKYKFYIDQAQSLIYNNDSLPLGSDPEHIICSVSSANSGIILIKYTSVAGEDSLVYYSSSDSIDFSTPREFRVYSTDGTAYRPYTIKVNVHTESPDSFRWSNCATVNAFKGFSAMKAAAVNGNIAVLGSDGSKTTVYTTANTDGATWTQSTTELDADAYKNTAVLNGTLYTVSGGQLKSTTDGTTWTDVAAFTHAQLLGAGTKKLYALSTQGTITASDDNGQTWTEQSMDGTTAQLPASSICMATLPLATDENCENIVMTGIRDLTVNPTDTAAVVWGKVEEYNDNAEPHTWVCYESENDAKLPALTNLAMTRYGNVLVAMGGSPLGQTATPGFAYLYMSLDEGLTWQTDTDYILPDNFTNGTSDTFALTAGDDNILWIISGATGQVWRGRLNKLGWKTYKDSFTE